MEFNDTYFSYPPHLSALWEQIAAIAMNPSGRLEVHLKNSETITLPELSAEQTDQIFRAHANALRKLQPPPDLPNAFRIGIAADGLTAPLQHNPKAANAPELPPDVIEKIAQATRMVIPKEHLHEIKPEPNCQCTFCQIATLIHTPEELLNEGEPVLPEELHFEEWDIKQTGEKLYTVTNKLDTLESYSVYLGQPIGCTCGKENCDHILSVLKS